FVAGARSQAPATDESGDRIVAQTPAGIIPLSRKRYEEILAEKQARLDAWNALTPLQRLRIELEEFQTELAECQGFSNLTWAQQRIAELTTLIPQTKYKIERCAR